jgi:hypothetical protein
VISHIETCYELNVITNPRQLSVAVPGTRCYHWLLYFSEWSSKFPSEGWRFVVPEPQSVFSSAT